jgi:hypothetical protein
MVDSASVNAETIPDATSRHRLGAFEAVDPLAKHLFEEMKLLVVESDSTASLWPETCAVDESVDHRNGRPWSQAMALTGVDEVRAG